jgi:hypothetical protein
MMACPEAIEAAIYPAHTVGGRGAVYEIIRHFYAINKFDWHTK